MITTWLVRNSYREDAIPKYKSKNLRKYKIHVSFQMTLYNIYKNSYKLPVINKTDLFAITNCLNVGKNFDFDNVKILENKFIFSKVYIKKKNR